MAEHMVRCLAGVRAFLASRTRGGDRVAPAAGPSCTARTVHTVRTVIVRPRNPPYLPFPPARRGWAGEPIDGDATALVRPYLVAAEQRQQRQRRQRRRALALATLGIDDPGPYRIHGVEVA